MCLAVYLSAIQGQDMSMNRPRRIDLLGVATASGASVRGCGMGPEALRVAGLAEALIELDHDVADHGDLRRLRPAISTNPASTRLTL